MFFFLAFLTNSDEDDDEDASDVVDADSVALVFDFGTTFAIEVPPLRLEVFQHALVEKL